MIETRGLTKRFGSLTAVDRLDLTIAEGDLFGFIGPNGAGKTTTMRMLATLEQPTSGGATVCGLDLKRNPSSIRSRIGYMPDSFGVYDDLTVWEYLDFFGAAYGLKSSKRKQIIPDVLALTDLLQRAPSRVEDLSRGMKQRLGLARVLVHDPQVLILDEPASGLDPRARIEIRSLLQELQRMGKTIVISSHILVELADLCNKVGIIEGGRLLFSGTMDELRETVGQRGEFELKPDPAEAEKVRTWLDARPDVAEVADEKAGRFRVRLKADGDPPALLSALCAAGFRIHEFHERDLNLEDIFLVMTKGMGGD